ncbi:alpha/beta fold hydrolase [Streptomyces endophyticus]|uniref:Alpha/beta hydrolase n=1 Tax=Streptomyces endophyticus TaxID=714166 RepID=A0ABU6F2T1_9ACTN|nr:alpha/beta hydrolase [Streptomyces endophyticus]MEB8338294.1 alpha/beta hydrolase [Streptomyces endophyticus]
MPSEFESPESLFGPVASLESIDGTAIAYRQFGSGPPVVMVHGSGGGLHSWQPVAERLADRYEVWTPARRGYAPSGPGRSPKRFADEVADLGALITKIGRPVHLVGMSYGANVALHAATAGLPVRSLVLWEPPLYAAGAELGPVLAEFQELTAQGDQRRADRLLAEKVARVPAALLDMMGSGDPDDSEPGTGPASEPATEPAAEPDETPGWCRDLESLIADSADVERWSDVTVPTLLMRGADTWQPMPATLDRLAAALPHVTYTTLPGQMHFAPSLVPDTVAAEIADFLPRT